ncbi:alpha-L-rhamnosidase-like protein [Motilibacter rhizosphaerae]|uniref:Alpha-L-rhamnosidase-like protein n=1 Tax=Motilibacter rhizosphaerae TaxID=598652 RepID=A0A4Q7N749_9ACTN|nr:alpha-L-rhamnosidase-like protein [Motilibacter rhizosphaerae]
MGVPDPVPTLTAASFASPPTTVRPKYRWWVPLAYTQDDELRAEVAQIAAAGAGGVEVSPFAVPGQGNRDSSFLTTYGWGTPLWTHKLQVILAAANQYGLTVDQNLGPNYPPTVPTVHDVNDPAAAQQIVYGQATLAGGTAFTGALPQPTTAPPAGARTTLVSVVAARCTDAVCAPSAAGTRQLDRTSLVDITGQVQAGQLTWSAPAGAGTWVLLAFYQTADGLTKTGYEATTPDYVVDHLSSTGAKALESFWESTIFTPQTQQLIDAMQGPGSIFEDSLEMGSHELWTSDFASRFASLRGYPVSQALPALTGIGQQGTGTPAYDFSDGSGARFRQDYRQTWSDLYIDQYVSSLQQWAEGHHLDYRAQFYGDPIATGRAAQVTGIPEGESIDFGSPTNLGVEQDYRVVAGGARAVQTTRISTECCGIFNGAYRSTVAGRDLDQDITGPAYVNGLAQNGNLDTIYKAYAGGVTQVVWHGFAYAEAPTGLASPNSGEGGAWPGYNPWNIQGFLNVGELFGPRLPTWQDYRSVNDSLARDQLVLRQGDPMLDLAVYYQDLGLAGQSVSPQETPGHMLGVDSATARAGYSYDYLTPDALAGTFVGDGRLARRDGKQKALILANQTTMPVPAAQRILTLAQQGLPVVVIGAAPSAVPGAAAAGEDAALQAVVAQLLAQPGVHQVATEAQLPQALHAIGVDPDAAPTATTGALETVHRDAGGTDYYLVYNRSGSTVDTTVQLTGGGRAYRLDSWTGSITALGTYTAGDGSVSVPLHLAAYDTTVFAVTRNNQLGAKQGSTHAVTSTADEVRYTGGGSLAVRSTTNRTVTTTLDDGRTITTPVSGVTPPQALGTWQLSVESWTPGATQSQTLKTVLPTATVQAGADGSLPAWSEIPGRPDLLHASGVGTYTTTVDLPGNAGTSPGAHLDLGKAVDTVRLQVNGRTVGPLDQSDLRRIDLAGLLHAGRNTISVTVSTTLYDAVKTTGGATYRLPDQRVGLLGPVTLTPYGEQPVR